MFNKDEMKAVIEGLLFISGEAGIYKKQISDVLQLDHLWVNELLTELITEYNDNKARGLQIVQIAGAYQFVTKEVHVEYYKRLITTASKTVLSQAALETLAIVAYKQPITRIEIEEIRGVKSERPLHTLVAKQLIKEIGRTDNIGRAIIYGTTPEFLEQFGLSSLKELPPLLDEQFETSEQEVNLFTNIT